MRKHFILLAALLVSFVSASAGDVKVERIWDNGYSAFTSIVKFQGKYYISFREAESHIFDSYGNANGKARVLVSEDGKGWTSVALLEKPGYDLRDPKLSVTPDGKLMLVMGGSIYVDRKLMNQIPQVSFSEDGMTFSEPEPVVFNGLKEPRHGWLWRVTWQGDTGYGVFYANPKNCPLVPDYALVKTMDGKNFDKVCDLDVPDFPGETTVRFLKDGRMSMMVRREDGDKDGYWGVSQSPYTDWKWTKVGLHLGGPDYIVLDDSRIIVGTRGYFTDDSRTILLKGDASGKFETIYTFPSGGDTSYPGFLVVGDELWMVYYSSHELGRAAIYMAKMPLTMFD